MPCDLVILSTNTCSSSDPCFITTTNIDGETDIKNRLPLQVSAGLSIPEFLNESPLIYCENENANTSSFDGIIRLSSGASEHIGIRSVILRGCRVVFTSRRSALSVNRLGDRLRGCCWKQHQNRVFDTKSTGEERVPHASAPKPVQYLSHRLAALHLHCFNDFMLPNFQVSSVMSTAWDQKPHGNIDVNHDNLVVHFIQTFFVYFQLCYQIVPASLYVCVEIAYRFASSFCPGFFFSPFLLKTILSVLTRNLNMFTSETQECWTNSATSRSFLE